jgi:WD40 repeat protein
MALRSAAVVTTSPNEPLLLATAGSDACVRVYDEASGALAATLQHGDGALVAGHSNAVFGLAWAPDDPQVCECVRMGVSILV